MHRAGGRGDARPVKVGARKQGVAHVAIEVGVFEPLGKKSTVNVPELGEVLIQVLLSVFLGGIEHAKEPV